MDSERECNKAADKSWFANNDLKIAADSFVCIDNRGYYLVGATDAKGNCKPGGEHDDRCYDKNDRLPGEFFLFGGWKNLQ